MSIKPDFTLTSADVRAFDAIWIQNKRIIYAILYGGRILKIEEWSQERGMHAPAELPDNVVEGFAAEPRFLRLGWAQVRLMWTAQDGGTGNWKLRYHDLPFYAE